MTTQRSGHRGKAARPPIRRRGRRIVGRRLSTAVLVAALCLASAPPVEAAEPGAGALVTAVDPCAVTDELVNPCRPWLGAVADHYPGLGSWRAQIEGHEQRIGRPLDVVHGYRPAGKVRVTADERHFATRGGILYLNWKPADVWADATGANATVNAQIDTMAAEVKSLGSHRIMLSLSGEPERHVTPGTSACPELRGSSGSPAQYRAMWAHVQDRFAAAGVTNVVWVMNYLGFVRWDCLFGELWPGNDRVDWIMWDPYVGPRQRFVDQVGYFYRAMERQADADHAYTSKPWGLAEYGYWYGTDQDEAYRFYDDALAFATSGDWPRLKLYEIYDTTSEGRDVRVGYDAEGVADPVEQAHYNAFAQDPIFSDGPTPPPPPPAPPPPPTDHFEACDTSVESGLSCFAGAFSPGVRPRPQTADGNTGTRSVQVTNTTATTGPFGLNVKPTPVASTVVGRTYTGAAWVRASRVGMPIRLLLRERRADGSAPPDGYVTATWVATDTQWHRIEADYTAKEAGRTLTYSVYGSQMAPGQWMRADDFSLTSS